MVILLGNTIVRPLSAVLVLLWARWSNTPWRAIGYVRPKSWTGAVMVGLGFGVAFKFLMKAVVMPLLGAPPVNAAYHYLAGNEAALPGAISLMIVGAGFGEETVYRGFLFERLGKLIGHTAGAKTVIVLGSALFFASLHYADQGLAGTEQAVITGLVFGAIYMITGRLVMLMVAHAAFDLAAVAMIYWDVEASVAHFFFK